jgi:hypothetical protein
VSEKLWELIRDLREAKAQGPTSWPVLDALNHVADRIEEALKEEGLPPVMLESTAKGLDDWREKEEGNKIFLGTNRPEFNEFMKNTADTFYMACPCGVLLSRRQSCHDHWMLGHFDHLVTATREEVLDRLVEKLAKKEAAENE